MRACYKHGMELRGDDVVLRPLAEADVETLVRIGQEPGVKRWWQDVNAAGLREKIDATTEHAFAILVGDAVAGLIQYEEEPDPEYRQAGIDLFLGEHHQGRGLGVDAVRTLARHLVDDLGHHLLTIDPAAANERAIRCYEKVGFRRVGVIREYWTDAAGTRHDGLLMDLLASELT